MAQRNEALWSLFERTGSIVFYLLYRATAESLAKAQASKNRKTPVEQQ